MRVPTITITEPGACDVAFSVTNDWYSPTILGGPPEILYTEYSALINVTTGFG